jgi:hypothetical protein
MSTVGISDRLPHSLPATDTIHTIDAKSIDAKSFDAKSFEYLQISSPSLAAKVHPPLSPSRSPGRQERPLSPNEL